MVPPKWCADLNLVPSCSFDVGPEFEYFGLFFADAEDEHPVGLMLPPATARADPSHLSDTGCASTDSLTAADIFVCTSTCPGQHWVDMSEPVVAQNRRRRRAKNSGKGGRRRGPAIKLAIGVKFFVSHPNKLIAPDARWLVYYQLLEDMVKGEFLVEDQNVERHMIALAAQASPPIPYKRKPPILQISSPSLKWSD